MGKQLEKAKRKLEARQKAFDSAGWASESGKKRPGSMKVRR